MLARESRLTQTNEEIRVYIYIYQCHIDRQAETEGAYTDNPVTSWL